VGSEIDAATVLFPVSVPGWIRPVAAAVFDRLPRAGIVGGHGIRGVPGLPLGDRSGTLIA